MIRELFQKDHPVFVRFDNRAFRVGPRRRDRLQGRVVDMQPVRKRFEAKRLVCWANDAITGRNGQRCALCRQRWSCAERLRLMLLLDGLEQDPVPTILEIGHGSFDAFEQFVKPLGIDNLPTRTVAIGMTRHNGRLRFTFQPVG